MLSKPQFNEKEGSNMSLQEDVLKTLPYDWKPYVDLNDEDLQKKINGIIKMGDIIFVCGVLSSIVVAFAVYHGIEYNGERGRFPNAMLASMGVCMVSFLALFFINRGHDAVLERFQPIHKFAVLQDKVNSLKRLSPEANNWAIEQETKGRTLRVFDLDIMQSLKEISEYYKERKIQYKAKNLNKYKDSTHIYFN